MGSYVLLTDDSMKDLNKVPFINASDIDLQVAPKTAGQALLPKFPHILFCTHSKTVLHKQIFHPFPESWMLLISKRHYYHNNQDGFTVNLAVCKDQQYLV